MRVRIIIVTLFISAILFGCTPGPVDEGNTPVTIENLKQSGQGHLDRVYKKILVVTLKGSHSEIGKQHGELLKNEIKNYYDKVCLPYMEKMEKDNGFGRDSFLAAAKEYLLPHIPGEFNSEMHQIAEATGISFDNVLLINTFVDIASVLAGKNTELTPFAGVSFGFVTELTEPKSPMIARNIDLRFGINPEYMKSYVFVIHPKQGKPYIYVSWPGMVGTLSGMNLSGLVMTSNPVTGPKGMAPGIPYTMLTRKALQECDTVPNAHQLVLSSKPIGGNSFLMCDTANKIWKIECAPRKLAVSRTREIPKHEGEQPTYTLSSFDTFVSSILSDECITMAAHKERAQILSTRLSNLGDPWTDLEMFDFSSKLAIPGQTALSIVFIPGKKSMRIWNVETGDNKSFMLDENSTYEIINLK